MSTVITTVPTPLAQRAASTGVARSPFAGFTTLARDASA